MTRKLDTRLVLEKPHRARGLFAAALAAWTFFVILATAVPLIAIGVRSLVTHQDALWPTSHEMFGAFPLMAAIGLPISLMVCFVVGYPIWRFASARGLATRRAAIVIGTIVGAVLYLAVAVYGHIAVYMGDSNFSYSQGGVLLTKDNLPTFQGILFNLFLTVFYAATGAVAGLTAWLAGGDKSAISANAQG
ncbi:MAG: hypothetical protein J0H40_02405 [Rhizobiales bacterium]|nr:hypothetical protein [Hyphomicrobiales bacterium]